MEESVENELTVVGCLEASTGTAEWTDQGGGESVDEPAILEEIEVEELAVDGICGVY